VKRECVSARCDNDFCQRKAINNPAACLSRAIQSSEFPSIQGVGSVCGGTSQHPGIVDRIMRCITTMLSIISTLSFLYTTLQYTYFRFILISVSHSSNCFIRIARCLLNHDKNAPHFSSSSSPFQHREKRTIYPWPRSRWWSRHNTHQLPWSSSWQFRIWPWASSATILGVIG